MSLEDAADLIRNSLLLTLLIASPMMIVGLLVGLVISIVQAVTQIQEQTLTFIPKITAMMIAAALLMPWISMRLVEYAQSMFAGAGMP
jgi:flagellar biosynthesis protein FliQ